MENYPTPGCDAGDDYLTNRRVWWDAAKSDDMSAMAMMQRNDPMRAIEHMRNRAMRQMMDNVARQMPMIVMDRTAPAVAALAAKPAPADPYAPFKEAIKAGKEVEWMTMGGEWKTGYQLNFSRPPEHYRVKDSPALPFDELRAAHAKGKAIQFESHGGTWKDFPPGPVWFLGDPSKYRIKPDAPTPEPAKVTHLTTDGSAPDTIHATEGAGTASIPWPYNVEPDPPSTALPALAGLGVVWQDSQYWRR